MKVKKNKGAFIASELITIIVVCLVLFAIISIIIYQSSNSEKFHIMKYNASNLATSFTGYGLNNIDNDTAYLKELIDNGVHTEIKSPFNGASKCSSIDSYVKSVDSKKYVTLKCGSYLIDNQYVGEKEYKIYKISDWSLEKPDSKNIEERKKYNIEEKGSEVYSDYYDEDLFIYIVNKDNNTSYSKLDDIKKNKKVVEKTFYREKKVYIEKQK